MAADVDLDALCEQVVARDVAVAFPGLAHDTRFVEHLRQSVRENLDLLQRVLAGRLPMAGVHLEQPLEFARVQARLRTIIKRLLRKHGYPPEKRDKAAQAILKQAEQWPMDWAA